MKHIVVGYSSPVENFLTIKLSSEIIGSGCELENVAESVSSAHHTVILDPKTQAIKIKTVMYRMPI